MKQVIRTSPRGQNFNQQPMYEGGDRIYQNEDNTDYGDEQPH